MHHAGFSSFAERAGREAIRVLRRNGVRSGLVVDVGCGSGVLARRLLAAGYDVFGIDASPAMVRLARKTAPGARFEVASLADAEIPRCGAVVAMGEVVNYLSGARASARLGAFFVRCAGALAPGGLLILDFLAPHAGSPRAWTRHVRGDGWDVVAEVREDARARLTRRITTFRRAGRGAWRRTEEVHEVRLRAPGEMASLLARAGLEAVIGPAYGSFRLPPGHLVALARRPPLPAT